MIRIIITNYIENCIELIKKMPTVRKFCNSWLGSLSNVTEATLVLCGDAKVIALTFKQIDDVHLVCVLVCLSGLRPDTHECVALLDGVAGYLRTAVMLRRIPRDVGIVDVEVVHVKVEWCKWRIFKQITELCLIKVI